MDLSCSYCLAYHDRVRIHLVFRVSCLKEILSSDDNIATMETLVTSEDLVSKPHVLERIPDVKTKHLGSKTISESKR